VPAVWKTSSEILYVSAMNVIFCCIDREYVSNFVLRINSHRDEFRSRQHHLIIHKRKEAWLMKWMYIALLKTTGIDVCSTQLYC
jgi:hypothetical protein